MPQYSITAAEDTVPASTAVTGTVTSAANSRLITGTSTAFTTELQVGQYLFDDTNDEIRRIASIQSDTVLHLQVGFTNPLSGATVKKTVGARQISVSAGGDITTIDLQDNTMTLLDGNTSTPAQKANGLVEPFIVDPGANTAYILVVF